MTLNFIIYNLLITSIVFSSSLKKDKLFIFKIISLIYFSFTSIFPKNCNSLKENFFYYKKYSAGVPFLIDLIFLIIGLFQLYFFNLMEKNTQEDQFNFKIGLLVIIRSLKQKKFKKMMNEK